MSAAIVARAMHCLGTPFRLYGRTPGVALDCVGLAGFAAGWTDLPRDYTLCGEFRKKITAYMDKRAEFVEDRAVLNGDIALVCCCPRQQHLMVKSHSGWVHAHAGLGRVVQLTGESPWPVLAAWRLSGE